MKKVFEAGVDREVKAEDSGQALILELSEPGDSGMFVRVQSWDERKAHAEFRAFDGKRIRVTIEAIE